MRVLILALFVALLLCVVGCKSKGPAPLNISEESFGQTFITNPGQMVHLELSESGGTGYTWHYSWTPKEALQEVPYTGPRAKVSKLPGSNESRHILFRPLKSGQVKISLQKGRWWAGGEKLPPEFIKVAIP